MPQKKHTLLNDPLKVRHAKNTGMIRTEKLKPSSEAPPFVYGCVSRFPDLQIFVPPRLLNSIEMTVTTGTPKHCGPRRLRQMYAANGIVRENSLFTVTGSFGTHTRFPFNRKLPSTALYRHI